jgi:dienelactone hydrolase
MRISASPRRVLAYVLATLLFAFAPHAAGAKVIEDIVDLPITVTVGNAPAITHTIKLTIFRDDTRAKSPFLVLNHGRGGKADVRAALGRARYGDNAKYLVGQGYAVFVPTRMGYGVTGGPDVENSVSCQQPTYVSAYGAAAQLTRQVIDYARKQTYVDPARGIVMGQSFGGATALAIAGERVPGVLAAINFAGGGGGNPETRPENPCRPDRMTALFATYGKTSRIPTLWLYSANDKYWGRELPKTWLKAFTDPGGKAQFVELPANGDNGHSIFTANPAAWKPAVESFLKACCKMGK